MPSKYPMIEERKVEAMNQRLVDSVAQIISAMSDEERQSLEQKVQLTDKSQLPIEDDKAFRVAELAQDIQSFEEKYNPVHPSSEGDSLLTAGPVSKESQVHPKENSLHNSFLQVAQSLNLEGPDDWSINVDHYLYGLPTQDA
ncbi:MAG: hypothetical protein ABG776_19215 [Cyanobacteria bacterium J06555_13]